MKRTTIFRILTLLYLAGIAVLCFGKFSNLSQMPGSFLGIPTDKLVHFAMFLPFPALTFFSLRMAKPGVVKVLLVIIGIFIVGCLLAWGTEYVQGMLPYRTMDPEDFAADRMGLICGSLIAFLIKTFSRPKKDA